MIDFKAICNGLAARFAPGTIATPTGASAMRAAYGQVPKNIPTVPAVVIEPSNGTVIANPGQWEHQLNLQVVFLLSKRPGDTARVETQRQLWLPTLLAATEGKMKLGLAGQVGWDLQKAIPMSWRWAEYHFGGDEYDAIVIDYRVFVLETVSLTP